MLAEIVDDTNVFAWYGAFLFSTVIHEASHALVGKLGGDDTAYQGGQVSLNPIPHIERQPMGMVAMPLISLHLMGFPLGVGTAPYDPTWAYRYPKRAALI